MFAATSFVLGLVASVAATTYDINVGGSDGKLEYSPQAIGAQPGDQVIFHFQQKNHTLTQSSFADPCGPLSGGIDSGFMAVPANQTDNFPTYTVQVKDTKPMWFYCKQAAKTPQSHCGAGMVFAINCGASGTQNSFDNFVASAKATLNQGSSSGGYGSSSSASGSSTASAPSSTSSSSSSPTVHQVIVGGPGLLEYSPSRVDAQKGDIVQFVFKQKNHTVTQSSFAAPCTKISATNSSAQGFASGFIPVADNVTDNFPTWNLTVNDTTPIWAYCGQTGHCASGMVFAINSVEGSNKSFSAFQAAAKATNGSSASNSSGSSSGSAPSASGGASGSSGANGAGLVSVSGAVFSLVAVALGALLL